MGLFQRVSLGVFLVAGVSTSSCVDAVGGEGQPCSPEGKCSVGFRCESGVCRASAAGTGGQTASVGGDTSGGRSSGSGGREEPADGGSSSSGGKSSGGSGGNDESGGAAANGGSESTGGETSAGGTSSGGTGSGGGPVGNNLLENGDFADGEAHWKCDCGSAQTSADDGAYCITSSGDAGFGFSAPAENEDPFALESGQTYVLYYRAKGAASWTAKVGLADPPYDAFGEFQDSVGNANDYQVFQHEFTPQNGSERVGFIFQGSVNGSICFDDVFLGVPDE